MDKRIIDIAEQLNALTFKLVGIVNDSVLDCEQRKGVIHIMSPQRKRPKEGSISQRKDGRFEGRYAKDGRQCSVYSKSYDDCFKKLAKAIQDRDIQTKQEYTLYSWISEYLVIYKKNEIKTATYSAYESYFKNYIQQFCEDKPLKDVKAMDIKKLVNSIEAHRTCEAVYNLLSGCFKQAIAEQLITFNPMLGVKRVVHVREKGTALSQLEQTDFMQKLQGHYLREYYLFCLLTGCRRSEALAVRYEDIDFVNKVIAIHGTKTAGSNRTIPLFDSIVALLPNLPKAGKLFNFKPDTVTRNFKKLCPNHHLHDLRHTFATRCSKAGISLKVMSCWLGHSTIDITADIYLHVTDDYGKQEAEKLKDVFKF